MGIDVKMNSPSIMKGEMEKAMMKMKEGKAMVEQRVNIEMLNIVQQFSMEKISRIANIV